MAKSNWKWRYVKKTQKWIPYRYLLYNYWWQFLKIAYEEKRKIDWKYYSDWGTSEEIFATTFRTWWVNNWERLFAVDGRYENPIKFQMSSKQAKPESIKVALTVYRLKKRFKGKLNNEIYDWVMDNKVKTEIWKKPYGSLFDFGKTVQDNKEINRNIKRYTNQAETILKNVCVGKFP